MLNTVLTQSGRAKVEVCKVRVVLYSLKAFSTSVTSWLLVGIFVPDNAPAKPTTSIILQLLHIECCFLQACFCLKQEVRIFLNGPKCLNRSACTHPL